MGRQFFTVAGPLDDYLEAGVGQPVQSAVPEDWVVEEAEPFLHGAVAGDDEAGDVVSADDQLVGEFRYLVPAPAVEIQGATLCSSPCSCSCFSLPTLRPRFLGGTAK